MGEEKNGLLEKIDSLERKIKEKEAKIDHISQNLTLEK